MECVSSSSSDEWEQELEESCAAFYILKSRNKKHWIHEINKTREKYGAFHTLIKELELNENRSRYHMYFRMNKEQFDYLHDLLKEKISKCTTKFRKSISSKERLAICLRYLATGASFRSIGFSFRVGFSTVRSIVSEVCKAIWEELSPIVMPKPTAENWKKIASSYRDKWNFPNCIGAIDGKHINIRCPINGGSAYYNYKGTNSIVLLALVDANYKFIAVDVGSYGRNSDGNIFAKSALGKSFEAGKLNVPADEPLEENQEPLPYVIVGDEAFPLKPYLLRPYSRHTIVGNEEKKIFNYRLSRARRIFENAFGILAARWRVFTKNFEVQPKLVDEIVLACCCLHNLLCTNSNVVEEVNSFGTANSCLGNIAPIRLNSAQRSFYVRDKFKEYFNSPIGSVPWQTDIVRRGRRHNPNNQY